MLSKQEKKEINQKAKKIIKPISSYGRVYNDSGNQVKFYIIEFLEDSYQALKAVFPEYDVLKVLSTKIYYSTLTIQSIVIHDKKAK